MGLENNSEDCEYAVARRAEVRQRVRQLDAKKAAVVAQMNDLVDSYRNEFRVPPARVVMQRLQGGHRYLRWRVRVEDGDRFLVNAEEPQTQVWIRTVPSAFRFLFLGYVRQSLDLNLLHGMFHIETIRLRQYLNDRQALDRLIVIPPSR